jgi:hypothetical protein
VVKRGPALLCGLIVASSAQAHDARTVRWRDLAGISETFTGCTVWGPIQVNCGRHRPDVDCAFNRRDAKAFFAALQTAREAPGVVAPEPSNPTFRIEIALRDGRRIIAQAPMSDDTDGAKDPVWLVYDGRNMRLDRANWDRIEALSQMCERSGKARMI